jgi:hypothetical protein
VTEESKNLPVPIKSGGVEITTQAELDALLDDTVGKGTGVLDGLTIYRQSKDDYFNVGDGRRNYVDAIFLLSKRPTRAFWEKDEITQEPPSCYSFDNVTPHPTVEEPQSPKCEGCPQDQPGSGKGNSRKCKSKANDFVLLLPDEYEKDDDNKIAWPRPSQLAAGLLMYSVSNKGSARAYQEWLRVTREKGQRPQGVVTRWSFGKDRSKSGIPYSFVKQDFVMALPSTGDDPELWGAILKGVASLKGGASDSILLALTGTMGGETTE